MSNGIKNDVTEIKLMNNYAQIMLEIAELLLKEELITFAEKLRISQMIREGDI